MPDEKVSYLEPIEEGPKTEKKMSAPTGEPDQNAETSPVIEATVEKETGGKSEMFYQKILATATTAVSKQTDDHEVSADAEHIGGKMDAESRVKQLVDLALHKGVTHAVKVARKIDDFYVLDQMHDTLANTFYDALVEKGLIVKE